jgi:hypothetical protein
MPIGGEHAVAVLDEDARQLPQQRGRLETKAMRQRGRSASRENGGSHEGRGADVPKIERLVMLARRIADLQYVP